MSVHFTGIHILLRTFNCTHHLSSVISFNQGLHSSLPLFLLPSISLTSGLLSLPLEHHPSLPPPFLHVKAPSANHYSCATCCINGLRSVTTPTCLLAAFKQHSILPNSSLCYGWSVNPLSSNHVSVSRTLKSWVMWAACSVQRFRCTCCLLSL